MDRYVAHLIGHPAEIGLSCSCTRVLTVSPIWVMERCGMDATIEEAERRLICKDCGQRAKLEPKGQWSVRAGRDMRRNPPPMPSWVDLT